MDKCSHVGCRGDATMTDIKNWLDDLVPNLQTYPRIAIVGGPRTGKTTSAVRLAQWDAWPGCQVLHADSVIHLGWSEASAEVANWLEEPGGIIVEGVAVPRALRKWLGRDLPGKPVDIVAILTRPFIALTPGQERMAKGVATVLAEIRPDLEDLGVLFVEP